MAEACLRQIDHGHGQGDKHHGHNPEARPGDDHHHGEHEVDHAHGKGKRALALACEQVGVIFEQGLVGGVLGYDEGGVGLGHLHGAAWGLHGHGLYLVGGEPGGFDGGLGPLLALGDELGVALGGLEGIGEGFGIAVPWVALFSRGWPDGRWG